MATAGSTSSMRTAGGNSRQMAAPKRPGPIIRRRSAAPIGRASAGGSVIAVYDVNGDRLNDVVTSLAAHGWGLAWYEQKRDAAKAISFVQHMVMDDYGTKNAGDVTFSQLHGSTHADVDGDGVQDFIVGKRYWSHQDTQIDPGCVRRPCAVLVSHGA